MTIEQIIIKIPLDKATRNIKKLTPSILGRVAGILAPHSLQVGSADGAIGLENTVQLRVVVNYKKTETITHIVRKKLVIVGIERATRYVI